MTLRRKSMPSRKVPLPRGTGLERAPRKPRARRDTGPSRAVRAVIWERAKGACESCGKRVGPGHPYSVQHRVARGMGGTSDPAANALFNLVLLCGSATTPGSCHALAESRDEGMHARGFWLWSWEDPEAAGVTVASGHGPGALVWLAAQGSEYLTAPPEGLAA